MRLRRRGDAEMVSAGTLLRAAWFGQSTAPGAVPPSSAVPLRGAEQCPEVLLSDNRSRGGPCHHSQHSSEQGHQLAGWDCHIPAPPHHAQCRWQCHHSPAAGTDRHQCLSIRAQHRLRIPGLHVTTRTCLHARLFLIDTACSPPILPVPQLAQLPRLNDGADKEEGVNCAYFLGAGRTQPSLFPSVPPPSNAGIISTNPTCCPSKSSLSPERPITASPKPWAEGMAGLPPHAIGMLQLTSLQPDPLSCTEPLFVQPALPLTLPDPKAVGPRMVMHRVAAQLPASKEPSEAHGTPVQGADLPHCPAGTLLAAASPSSAFLSTIPTCCVSPQAHLYSRPSWGGLERRRVRHRLHPPFFLHQCQD